MAYSGNKGFTRVRKATVYSWQGLVAAWRNEEAFRQEIWLCLFLVPLGLYLGDGGVEKALLVASVLLLPLVEILNSAIEAVVDRFGEEQHELSGRAKDMGSAAVALAILILGVVWFLILFVD
ncbi:MAG: diacylglycerol kinase [Pseudomonadota bacterium]